MHSSTAIPAINYVAYSFFKIFLYRYNVYINDQPSIILR